MARTYEPTPEQQRGWDEWVESRPPAVRDVARRFNPWTLYQISSTGDRVTIYSFGEPKDGRPVTVTVNVSGEYNAVSFERSVFGIDPDELVECELPAPGEPVGAVMTQEDVADNIDGIRLAVRPDLWRQAEDGTAVRKDAN